MHMNDSQNTSSCACHDAVCTVLILTVYACPDPYIIRWSIVQSAHDLCTSLLNVYEIAPVLTWLNLARILSRCSKSLPTRYGRLLSYCFQMLLSRFTYIGPLGLNINFSFCTPVAITQWPLQFLAAFNKPACYQHIMITMITCVPSFVICRSHC